jgi:transcriptional regulator
VGSTETEPSGLIRESTGDAPARDPSGRPVAIITFSDSLAIFHGPHAYISPTWYIDQPAVPTWNYAVVHAYGHPRVIDDDARVTAMLDDLIDVYESGESTQWRAQLPDDFRAMMERGIVAFEMPITRVEGKFKLGQNRSREDQLSAQRHVARQPDRDSGALAEFWSGLLAQAETR